MNEKSRPEENLEIAELHLKTALKWLEEGLWTPTPDQLEALEAELLAVSLCVEAFQQKVRNLGRD